MRFKLSARLVNIFERRAGQFKLPAGLQRNRATAFFIEQTNERVTIDNRRPAGRLLEKPDLLVPLDGQPVERLRDLLEREPHDRALDAASLHQRGHVLDRVELVALLREHLGELGRVLVVAALERDGAL